MNATVVAPDGGWSDTKTRGYVRFKDNETGRVSTWSYRSITTADGADVFLDEAQTVGKDAKGNVLVNSEIKGKKKGEPELHPVGHISKLPGGVDETGPLGPLSFFSTLQESEVVLWGSEKVTEANDTTTTVYFQKPTPGSQVLRPGEHPKFKGIRSDSFVGKLNFLSLMLALFCGTASLPHILIRYYTVKDAAAARKSTIVGIGSIGFFYVLTLYMGLGAMTSGGMDVTNSNMAAPLLAQPVR